MEQKKYYGHPSTKEAKKLTDKEALDKIWHYKCDNCEEVPVVRATGLCGPCTFGEADTFGGNW